MVFPHVICASVVFQKAKSYAKVTIDSLASIKVAVVLIVLLAVAIAAGSILDAKYGHAYSQWYVYHSSWFLCLLSLLAASVFSAAYVRFPWKRHQTGFVITHTGLLVLLAGSLLSYWRGIEGQIVLLDGKSTDQLTLNNRSQVTAYWTKHPNDRPYVYTFDTGPVDWKPGTVLSIGSVDGMSARILHYYQRSRPIENWVASGSERNGPLVRFRLKQPQSTSVIEASVLHPEQSVTGLLVDQDYGDEVLDGPIAIRLQRATSKAMLNDFLCPPHEQLGGKGVLTVYYQDEVQRVTVAHHVGKAIEIGNTGAKVELVQYLDDAKLDAAGKFQPIGAVARNPLVELKINIPGEEKPYRQVAFAKSPLLNFDGVYKRDCPVKFVYQHPKIKPKAAIEFLQSRDGKLYGRTIVDGKCESHGEVTTGSQLEIPGGPILTLTDYMPHARRKVTFKPAERSADDNVARESAAAEVEISVAGTKKSLWLQRNSPEFQADTIDTPGGPLCARFTTAHVPLGFSIELVDFEHQKSSGGASDVDYVSRI
ncbi:MAG TPA: hypothetical protein VHE81_21285, partial [Lacipirellulaceae bacterium]|nr:hypothetical protein [Lacipirellulaceae bacterium]